MNRIILFFTILFSNTLLTIAHTSSHKHIYKQAFEEQLQMLKGEKALDFKRAVFIAENAYHKGILNYQIFCDEITATGQKLKLLIKQRGLEKYRTAGNWAIFTYMTDTLPINNYQPYILTLRILWVIKIGQACLLRS